MSPGQHRFYISLWNQVCVEQGWYHLPEAEKTEKRRALHLQAKCPPSSKQFTNRHFDLFKAECLKIIAGVKHGGAQAVENDGERRRLVWRIKSDAKKAGLGPEYIRGVAKDLHVLGNWEDLDLDSLVNLRNTIHNRAGSKIGHDTRSVPQGRTYLLDAEPRMFAPRAGSRPNTAAPAPARGLPGTIAIDEVAYHTPADPENEPF